MLQMSGLQSVHSHVSVRKRIWGKGHLVARSPQTSGPMGKVTFRIARRGCASPATP